MEIDFRINQFNTKAKGKDALKQAMLVLTSEIDIDAIYDENDKLFSEILQEFSYSKTLKYYNRKSLSRLVEKDLGMTPGGFRHLVIRKIKNGRNEKLAGEMKKYTPSIT
ncbi:hypothetical protein [Paenibacillus auburnensis]|uniref:hypothetical protein n=1 Tax=Paenibacillus auburnensis TaxID=2905649 RepID=UPI001F3BA973|nr:hypothetical protein [Paenibacillus auburnensis]